MRRVPGGGRRQVGETSFPPLDGASRMDARRGGRVRRAAAPAKINLALVVGPRRADGKHEVATVLQRIDLADRVERRPARELAVTGFDDDTLVARAATAVAAAAGVAPRWRFHVDK